MHVQSNTNNVSTSTAVGQTQNPWASFPQSPLSDSSSSPSGHFTSTPAASAILGSPFSSRTSQEPWSRHRDSNSFSTADPFPVRQQSGLLQREIEEILTAELPEEDKREIDEKQKPD